MKTIISYLLTLILIGSFAAPAQASHRTRFNDKIDDLDNDIVEEIAVPVLFGVRPFTFNPDFGAPRDGGTRLH